jgi:hypothetical protein
MGEVQQAVLQRVLRRVIGNGDIAGQCKLYFASARTNECVHHVKAKFCGKSLSFKKSAPARVALAVISYFRTMDAKTHCERTLTSHQFPTTCNQSSEEAIIKDEKYRKCARNRNTAISPRFTVGFGATNRLLNWRAKTRRMTQYMTDPNAQRRCQTEGRKQRRREL